MSQLVTLHVDSKLISVLCHMGDVGCGDGGWTPVMKIDGNKVHWKREPEFSNLNSDYSVVSDQPFLINATYLNKTSVPGLHYLQSCKLKSIKKYRINFFSSIQS